MGNDDLKAKKRKKKEPEIKDIFAYSQNGLKECSGQDSYHFFVFDEGEYHIKFMGIYDGHGEKGKDASSYVETEIKKFVTENKKKFKSLSLMANSRELMTKFFGDAFRRIQKSMHKRLDIYNLSGSCLICALIVDKVCYVINLGDSRAVIGGKLIDNIFSIQMSIDHKPSLPEEMERIKKSGGEVKAQDNGLMRVYKSGDRIPGLAVSRTLGDILGHECGIIEDPQVSYRILDETDDFIVLGSDGVFDVMHSVEIVGYIYERLKQEEGKLSKSDMAKDIVTECRKRWILINKFRDLQMVRYIKNTVQQIELQTQYLVELTSKITEECISYGEQQKSDVALQVNSETNFEDYFTGLHGVDDITCIICFFK